MTVGGHVSHSSTHGCLYAQSFERCFLLFHFAWLRLLAHLQVSRRLFFLKAYCEPQGGIKVLRGGRTNSTLYISSRYLELYLVVLEETQAALWASSPARKLSGALSASSRGHLQRVYFSHFIQTLPDLESDCA